MQVDTSFLHTFFKKKSSSVLLELKEGNFFYSPIIPSRKVDWKLNSSDYDRHRVSNFVTMTFLADGTDSPYNLRDFIRRGHYWRGILTRLRKRREVID